MKNNKATISVDMMIWIAIGVVVFLLLLFIIPNLLGKAGNNTGDFLSSSKDYDGDGVADYFDTCPCNKEDIKDKDKCPKTASVCKKEIEDYNKNT
jgi:hypothetical protein